MTLDKLRQLVRVHNFKLHYLKQIGIDHGAIMSEIVPKVACLYIYGSAKKVIPELDREIQCELKVTKVFKYLTIRQRIKYIIWRINILKRSVT